MMSSDPSQTISALVLALVAGVPLLLTLLSCTPVWKCAARLVPFAVLPALTAVILVPADEVVQVHWFFMGGRMGLDETGRVFLCVTCFIWLLAGLSAVKKFKYDPGHRRFFGFFLAAMAGNFGLILAQGMLGYYLFFALMSFSAYGLVIHYQTSETRSAGRVYLLMVMVGEVALFLALVILAHTVSSLAIADLAGSSLDPVVLVLLFIGFGVKLGALPLHGWMAPAYQAAPIPAAAALAGAMVNAGLLGWLRFLPLGQIASEQGALLFIIAGAVAAFYGVIIGLKRRKPGEILACSSISQMGLMTVIFGLGLTSAEAGQTAAPVFIFYAVHHSLAKCSLFFGYDVFETRSKSSSSWLVIALLLPALALAGFPLTSGATVKIAFKELALLMGEPWSSLSPFFLSITAAGTTLLVLHFVTLLWRSEKKAGAAAPGSMSVWLISLLAVALVFWLWPAAHGHAEHSLQPVKLWQALWPVAGSSLLLFAWHKMFGKGKSVVSDPSVFPLKGDSPTGEPKSLFDKLISTTVNKEDLVTLSFNFDSFAAFMDLKLRKCEKIMGRWTVVGLSYLVLSFIILFLLWSGWSETP